MSEPANSAIESRPSSLLSAWLYLVRLSFRRQWRSVQSAVAVGLVLIVAILVGVRQAFRGWEPVPFGREIVNTLYLSLLPLLCLCFGTQALGGDWEERSLVWLLTRPLPRPLVYLAKFVAALPWTLALTLGGLGLLGVLAGRAGLEAVAALWPAIALATVAYLALFLLLGATFRRSTVIGVVYAFVLEGLVGALPGLMKRGSLTYYARCLIYDLARQHGLDTWNGGRGIAPDPNSLFFPVPGATAVLALAGAAAVLLLAGMAVFARREYHDLT